MIRAANRNAEFSYDSWQSRSRSCKPVGHVFRHGDCNQTLWHLGFVSLQWRTDHQRVSGVGFMHGPALVSWYCPGKTLRIPK